MATSLGIKTEDKVILGALAGAAKFKGLRLFFSRITSAFTTGQVKDFGSVGQVKGIQKVIAKFTMSETGIYRKLLEPIGFPRLGITDGKVSGFVGSEMAAKARIGTKAVGTKPFKKKIVAKKTVKKKEIKINYWKK